MIHMTLDIDVTTNLVAKALGAMRQVAGPLEVQPGCQACRILADVRSEGLLSLQVAWDTEEDLERHIRSDLFWKVLALMEVSSRKPEIRFHTVSRIEGLETIERIRGTGCAQHPKKILDRSGPTLRNR